MCRKHSKKIWSSIFLAGLFLVAGFGPARAQVLPIEYGDEPIADSDFDGLTDQGEAKIYKTDPQNQDTDGDGFYDGAEVLRATDPLDASDPLDFELAEQIEKEMISETPWAWYVTRSAGILGFSFLWLAIFLGLAIRNDLLKKTIEPIYSFEFHCFLGASALFWASVHGAAILFDKFFGMKIKDVLIPFNFKYDGFVSGGIDFLALGIIAFYVLVIIVATSYLRKIISHRIWRILHFLNPLAFVFVVSHGLVIGTDLKNIWARSIFLGASLLLVLVYLSSLFFVLRNRWKKNANDEIHEN